MPDGSREFLAAAAGVKTGMEYEDILMRNQKLAVENARLQEKNQRLYDVIKTIQHEATWNGYELSSDQRIDNIRRRATEAIHKDLKTDVKSPHGE